MRKKYISFYFNGNKLNQKISLTDAANYYRVFLYFKSNMADTNNLPFLLTPILIQKFFNSKPQYNFRFIYYSAKLICLYKITYTQCFA